MVIKQFCCIFRLDSVWKNDFDFIHVLLRAVQRQDVQSSMERYKARWVNSYFSIFLLTDLWDCWLLTTCLSIILGDHKSLHFPYRVLGLTLDLSIECLKIQFTTVQRLESNEEGSLQLWTQFMWLLKKPEKNSRLQRNLNLWPRDTSVML